MIKEQILSCIQPTGEMHLGNYFGAIQNWVNMQQEFNCIYGVADYHAMTMPYEADILRNNTVSMLVDLIACGVEPGNIFIQSKVPEHTELAWILGCVTAYGELQRQVQFKDKSAQATESTDFFISGGLFTYPVLQAADILIYHADKVPVGKDQKQHLELARSIANRFNHYFKCKYFKEPECHFSEIPKIMSFADPTRKMSKSLGEKHYIGIFEEDNSIYQKVQQAITQTSADQKEMGPGLQNMFGILKACGAHQATASLLSDYMQGTLKFKSFKDEVYSAIIGLTSGFRASRESLNANRELVIERVLNSTEEIRDKAKKTLREVKEIVGLSQFKNNFS